MAVEHARVTVACLIYLQMALVSGHGRLMDPPARNTLWRFGFNNPVEFRDNELFCGGPTEYKKNGFKCGVCGDAFDENKPKYTAGGRFARGIIGRQYKIAQEIPVEVELTANHWGRFEMFICPNNDPAREATQSCFDKYPLYVAGTEEVKFEIPKNHRKWGIFRYNVRLPKSLTCSQCVLQWTYYTGRVWGRCENGTEALGCAGFSAFRNCADVSILGGSQGGNSLKEKPSEYKPGVHPLLTFAGFAESEASEAPEEAPPSASEAPPIEETVPQAVVQVHSSSTTNNTLLSADKEPSIFRDTEYLPPLPRPIRSTVCFATHLFKKLTGADEWCQQKCLSYPPVCPHKMCLCPDTCDATGEIANMVGAESFCQGQCILYPYQRHKEQDSRCHCYKADNDTNLYANYFEFSATNILDFTSPY